MKSIIVIEHDHDEIDAVASLLESLRADAEAQLDRIDAVVKLAEKHPDWGRGKPCPECGNITLSCMRAEEDIYVSEGGEFTYVDSGDAIGPVLNVVCPECDNLTTLEQTPVPNMP
jgi:ribosomal protein S27E